MQFSKNSLKNLDKVKKLNIINSITGIKPGNLIGTISKEHQENLAIFSSVIHLGSNPALIGFIVRPTGEVPRNTYENIIQNGNYTINSIPNNLIEKAHYTSVKFPKEINEFEVCKIDSYYIDKFSAPFVKESSIKIGMRFVEEIPIKINNTSIIVGEVEHIIVNDDLLDEKTGYIDLEKGNITGIGGLNNYYKLSKIGQFPYARENELPKF